MPPVCMILRRLGCPKVAMQSPGERQICREGRYRDGGIYQRGEDEGTQGLTLEGPND